MKFSLASISLILSLALAGCGSNSTPPAIPTVVLSSNPSTTSTAVTASGQVVPAQKAQLSFPLTGTVLNVAAKVGDLVAAGQTLVTLDPTLLDAQVKVAQANLDAAEAQLHYQIRIGTDQEHLTSAQADIDRAQAQLDSAKATAAKTTLVAPFNGTVVEVGTAPAETVVPGQIVIVLGDLTHLQIQTTDLSERDIPKVQVGQIANISIVALNQQQLTGKAVEAAQISATFGAHV